MTFTRDSTAISSGAAPAPTSSATRSAQAAVGLSASATASSPGSASRPGRARICLGTRRRLWLNRLEAASTAEGGHR